MAKLSPPPASQKEKPMAQVVAETEVRKSEVKKVEKSTVHEAAPKSPIRQAPPLSIKPLQLKVPETKKNEFKAYAAMRGVNMNSLFLDMFEQYKKNN